MVKIAIEGERATFEVQGLHKVWALKSRLEVPLRNIMEVRAEPGTRLGWWKGLRLPGTHIPGVIVAGTYYRDGRWTFWDVRHPQRAIVVKLANERYAELVVEVDDPEAVVTRLNAARSAPSPAVA